MKYLIKTKVKRGQARNQEEETKKRGQARFLTQKTGIGKWSYSPMKILFIAISLCLATIWAHPLGAATFTVTTTQDNVPGSLRAIITQANTNGQDNKIILPAGTYVLTGTPGEDSNATGDIDIDTTHVIEIHGENKANTIIDGNGIDRVIHIISGDVYIGGVTIRNGRAKDSDTTGIDGESGGGIYNSNVLELNDCIITANRSGDGVSGAVSATGTSCPSSGGSGGGIYNSGLLIMKNCAVSDNEAGNCGGAIDLCEDRPSGGHGGGIYNSNDSTMELTHCTIDGNSSGQGLDPSKEHEINNYGGNGGGIYNNGTQTCTDCIISYNYTKPGGSGANLFSSSGRSGDGGGAYSEYESIFIGCVIKGNFTGTHQSENVEEEGRGGGVAGTGWISIKRSTITENYTGHGGHGGGIAFLKNGGSITKSTVSNNYTGNGRPCGGIAGSGGGIYCDAYDTGIFTSTISGNRTGDGVAGICNYFGDGGDGGGLYVAEYCHLDIMNSTFTDNSTGVGDTEEEKLPGTDGRPGLGGGIYALSSPLFTTTIIAKNRVPSFQGAGPDYFGYFYNFHRYNLIGNTDGIQGYNHFEKCILNVDPLLGPLADNGGPTKTHALLLGSPAIDAGYRNEGSTDQRDYPGLVDIPDVENARDGGDIGAYEADLSIFGIPEINLSKTSLRFGADKAGNTTSPQTVIIDNTGTGTMQWTAQTDADWLSSTPTSGTGFSQITISVSAAGVQPGTYTGTVTVACPTAENSPQTITVIFTVYTWGVADPPFGVVDTPAPDIVATGSIGVTGWALDNIGLESVKIYRDPVSGEGKSWIFVGNTTFVEGARPDVQAAFPDYPDNYKAGWGYMLLTNFLPGQGNGTFTIHAVAVDKEGNSVNLGSRTIHCDNDNAVKPFGAIDTPPSGGTVSGNNYVNFGWALTPLPKTIPVDGSTITVWVDGQPLGHPVYNNYRKDIATLFPQYNNSDGAVGYYYLNTANYSNGVHTIAWSVKDDAGVGEGIGSRYFSIQNGSSRVASNSLSRTANLTTNISQDHEQQSQVPTELFSPLSLRTGFDTDVPFKEIHPDEQGTIDITVQRLEPLEIRFLDLSLVRLISPLPVGASLATEDGETRFRWLPGLAFAGPHRLSFLLQDIGGNFFKKSVVVHIGQLNKKGSD